MRVWSGPKGHMLHHHTIRPRLPRTPCASRWGSTRRRGTASWRRRRTPPSAPGSGCTRRRRTCARPPRSAAPPSPWPGCWTRWRPPATAAEVWGPVHGAHGDESHDKRGAHVRVVARDQTRAGIGLLRPNRTVHMGSRQIEQHGGGKLGIHEWQRKHTHSLLVLAPVLRMFGFGSKLTTPPARRLGTPLPRHTTTHSTPTLYSRKKSSSM